jgi:ubiquinone/menaquinone biosynthesis C-methylase UbiE
MGFYANKIFPWVLDVTEPVEMAALRRILLQDIKGKILEIGIGTGVNLIYYPENIKSLTAIEPSGAMQPRARQRAEACGRTVDWHQGYGECLPFEEECFDAVVSADVLCTVNDVDAVLAEAYRVLRPGGRLYFLDHGLAREEKIRGWQIWLNGLSQVVACGCELTRDIEKHIRNSEFSVKELQHVPAFSGMNAIYTHIQGIATKPG